MAGNVVRLVITADSAGALEAIRETSVAADESAGRSPRRTPRFRPRTARPRRRSRRCARAS